MSGQAPLQPKDKSDSKWLNDAGYSGIKEFAISYGFKFPDEIDEAKKLVDEFRKDQQKEWEAANTSAGSEVPPNSLIGSAADRNVLEKPKTDPNVLEKPKTDPKVIEAAILWHRRLGHISYHAVKHAPDATVGMGVDFSNLNIEDMPPCSACSSSGLNPFEDDEF